MGTVVVVLEGMICVEAGILLRSIVGVETLFVGSGALVVGVLLSTVDEDVTISTVLLASIVAGVLESAVVVPGSSVRELNKKKKNFFLENKL